MGMKLIVFSILLAYAMAVPAPGPMPESNPEAEADPAVLASYSTGHTAYALHYPYYASYYPYYAGYGHYYGLGYYGLGKRSAEPEPSTGYRSPSVLYRERREAEALPAPEAYLTPEGAAEAKPEAEAWYYYYGHYGYPYYHHYGYYGYPYYGHYGY